MFSKYVIFPYFVASQQLVKFCIQIMFLPFKYMSHKQAHDLQRWIGTTVSVGFRMEHLGFKRWACGSKFSHLTSNLMIPWNFSALWLTSLAGCFIYIVFSFDIYVDFPPSLLLRSKGKIEKYNWSPQDNSDFTFASEKLKF